MLTIPIIVAAPGATEEGDTMGIFSRFSSDAAALQAVPTTTLRQNLLAVTESVAQVFEGIRQVGQFKLKEVVLQVEVSADGGVCLIGTAKIGGKGAITLTFAE
jgi:hypothetical protein